MSMPIITSTPPQTPAAPETPGAETPPVVPTPPADGAPQELPADHPLVRALAAQKNELKELRAAKQRLQDIEDAEKSDAQRLADATVAAQAERDEARAEALRYKVAATHQVGEDYFDLLGSGDEATMTDRATRLAGLLAAKAENEQLKAENAALKAGKPAPTSIRPVVSLKPGASPEDNPSEADQIYDSLFGD